MPYIEINTVHNVVVSYETASWNDRAFALLIDCAIIFLALMVGMFCLAIMGLAGNNVLVSLLTLPFVLVYHLISENIGNGQSIGKRAMGIKVVKLTGRGVSFQDYFIRWVFRLVDILFSLGTLAMLLIASSNKGQRLGDILANTVVIRVKKEVKVTLGTISIIRNADNYQPVYPQAVKLSEEQALLIKNVLDRYKKYTNKASESLTRELTKKLVEELQIKEVKHNVPDFLKTLLRDYVVLTR